MEVYYSSDDEEYYYEISEDESDDCWLVDITQPSASASAICVITRESLIAAQSEDLEKIMEVLTVKEQHARTLLVHYRWDVEMILTVFSEKGRDRLFANAGVVESLELLPELPAMVLCNICIEDVPGDDVTAMDCGHYFCDACWTEYFVVEINEGHSRRIRCMAHQCNSVCDEAKVRALVSAKDPDLAEKFDRFLLESYIEDNKKVKWCPSVPHCGNALRNNNDDVCEAECMCGLQLCFGCMSEAHSPCSCEMWELWTQKYEKDSANMMWMTNHAKPCPKCNKMVEKNGGCNLVRCICRQPFCWLCGEATGYSHTWETIQGHSCGRLKEDNDAKKESKTHYRYMHYNERYVAHTESFKLETKMKETVEERVSKLEENVMFRDASWLMKGLERLLRSRKIISYTYAFAYYMFGKFGEEVSEKELKRKRILFEDHQQQLEVHVEQISSCLEKNLEAYSTDHVTELRLQIITETVLVDKLCGKLYECIENDLLGSLNTTHEIAPYKSKGIIKASKFDVNDSFSKM